jgi:HD superfamily phosphohydrolase
LGDVLRKEWKIEPYEVLDVLVARDNSPSNRLRRSILSGPIDIDKMDYLVRDSQHCGVPYGKHVDRNRLMNSLIVNEAGDGLAITSKGRTAAEMMVFARYVMFSEVYWHHAVRAATTMFARAFFGVLSLGLVRSRCCLLLGRFQIAVAVELHLHHQNHVFCGFCV